MPTSPGQSGHRQRLHPPFAQPDPGRRATPHMAAEAPAEAPAEAESSDFLESAGSPQSDDFALDSADAMPSIDRFVDDLPLIDEFLLEADAAPVPQGDYTNMTGSAPTPEVGETDSEGWAAGDWQSYDWSRLASLGAPAPEAAEAHAAWTWTNWDAGRHSADTTHLREDEVAAALVEIARRIRSGELSLHQFRGSPPEAAIAAAFASLLRNKG